MDLNTESLIPLGADGRPMAEGTWHIPSMLLKSPGLLALGEQLGALVDEGRPVVVLTPDLSYSNGLWAFRESHPDRYLQLGVSEQNSVSVAAGLATTGLQPYVTGFASFLALLCCEQIRTDLAYTQQPVRLVGHHSGITFGFYGTSHHATEDIAIMRSIANMTVVAPADHVAMGALMRAYADHPLPVYFRMGRGREPLVYQPGDERIQPGKAIVHSLGDDLTIIATGTSVHPSLVAAEELRGAGYSVGVIDMHTIKPLDVAAIRAAAERSRGLMTVEEHNVYGGLGGAVAETLTDHGIGVPLLRHGIRDEYALIGPPTHLYRHYRLDGPGVAEEARAFLTSGRITSDAR
ncbi:transketolase family protein [Nonomuraea sp. MCN248]|uniref:Transketolase family protein n=1 Tax=Nonomuraea corallina TaxID=2989783 RepID=A0ABT4SB66_9ACTN|nr:transketolase C-terminal domain-containing protein [Nonomuraea corallina]MDA0634397.1 transketolase family protein [Nonomuraea corallina]